MARSRTVTHTEAPETVSLFSVFFLLAVGWMAISAVGVML